MIKLPGLEDHENAKLIELRPALIAYRGSVAHGLFVPSTDPDSIDDIDLLQAYVAPLDSYFGLAKDDLWRGKDIQVKQYDMASYELRHFVSLLLQQNPNVLSALWLKPSMYLELSSEGKMLIENRKLFSSQRALDSFSGYAYSQLKRMTAYHDSGEIKCCKGEEFHLEDCPLRKERGRGSQKKFATGFMGAKRKSLVEKFGFDTKNAAHLIRLLRMGITFGETGELVVDREDAGDVSELRAIKTGEWSLEQTKNEAEKLFLRLHKMKDEKTSVLPEKPNYAAINDLLTSALSIVHRTNVSQAADEVLYRRNGWDHHPLRAIK